MQRDLQHGHFAETGFAAAQPSADPDAKGTSPLKGGSAADADADSGKPEATLPVGESGVLSTQQGHESSGRHKGAAHVSSDESKKSRRRKQHPRDANASSGDKSAPMDTEEAAEGSAQLHRRKDGSVHTDKRASKAAATPVAAHAVTDGLPSRKSGEEEEGPSGSAGASAEMRGNAPDAATDQSAKVPKSAEDGTQANHPSVKDIAAAGVRADADPTEAATSSGNPPHTQPPNPLQPKPVHLVMFIFCSCSIFYISLPLLGITPAPADPEALAECSLLHLLST